MLEPIHWLLESFAYGSLAEVSRQRGERGKDEEQGPILNAGLGMAVVT